MTENKKFYIETFGCAMNLSDTELIKSLLTRSGYIQVNAPENAHYIIINTCSIQTKMEETIDNRLQVLQFIKRSNNHIKIGLAGCYAQRLKEALYEKYNFLDFLIGPDSYKNIDKHLQKVNTGTKVTDTNDTQTEAYKQYTENYDNAGFQALIPVTRGCNTGCSFCIVPLVRGTERHRNPNEIIKEINALVEKNYKQITLVSQAIDKYSWQNELNFAQLLEQIAQAYPLIRIRFNISYISQITDQTIEVVRNYPNICNHFHIPVQSGSNRILNLMNRGYTTEIIKERISKIRELIPECGLTTDIITGYPTETETDHQETKDLISWAKFDNTTIYKYSERVGTPAAINTPGDISKEIKNKRQQELSELQKKICIDNNKNEINKHFKVIIENYCKQSKDHFEAHTEQNKLIIFPCEHHKIGDLVDVMVTKYTSTNLLGYISTLDKLVIE